VSSAGLMTQVLPETSAGNSFQLGMAMGKFHGAPRQPACVRSWRTCSAARSALSGRRDADPRQPRRRLHRWLLEHRRAFRRSLSPFLASCRGHTALCAVARSSRRASAPQPSSGPEQGARRQTPFWQRPRPRQHPPHRKLGTRPPHRCGLPGSGSGGSCRSGPAAIGRQSDFDTWDGSLKLPRKKVEMPERA